MLPRGHSISAKPWSTAGRAASSFINSTPTCTSDWAKLRQTSRSRCRRRNPIWHARFSKILTFLNPRRSMNQPRNAPWKKPCSTDSRTSCIEMGAGFAFVGNQYRLEVDGDEFFLDMLFYHTRLHCYIVIDLKIVDFEPEFAGKMSFYQAAVDNLIKTPHDAATIGIILCRGKNKTVVEYTLRDAKSPMGVAEYRLLPPKLKAKLPPVSQLKDAVTGVDVADA